MNVFSLLKQFRGYVEESPIFACESVYQVYQTLIHLNKRIITLNGKFPENLRQRKLNF